MSARRSRARRKQPHGASGTSKRSSAPPTPARLDGGAGAGHRRDQDPARAGLLDRRGARHRRDCGTARRHARGARRPPARARVAARARRGRPGRGEGDAPRRRGCDRRRGRPTRRADSERARRRARRGDRPAPAARHDRRRRLARRARRRHVGRTAQGIHHVRGCAMTRASDKALLRRYHEEGDLAAREQLIEQYLSLVRSLARRYAYRGEQLDDLIQIGCIGLIKAIDRFDIDRGVELTTYATPNIIGEIKRHFRDKGWAVRVPRGLQELNVQLSKIVEEQTVQLGRSPTIPELAKAAGVEEELVLEALESGRAYTSLSLSAGGSDEDGELDPLESLGTEEHQYSVSEDRAVLAPGFRALDERERRILHLRFFDGLTQSQIAQQVGISQMHVSRLIRRSLEKIRDEIGAEEDGAAPARKRAAG